MEKKGEKKAKNEKEKRKVMKKEEQKRKKWFQWDKREQTLFRISWPPIPKVQNKKNMSVTTQLSWGWSKATNLVVRVPKG